MSHTWSEAARRVAPALDRCAAVVVFGEDPDAVATVALAIAGEQGTTRRVAIADLLGDHPTLLHVSPGDADAPGVVDSFLYGISLTTVARAAPALGPNVFLLPSGSEPERLGELFASERWAKLAAGFREAGALLILAAHGDAPGLAALVSRTDGGVAVGVPPRDAAARPILAVVRTDELDVPAAPPSVAATTPPTAQTGARRWAIPAGFVVGILAVVLVVRWSGLASRVQLASSARTAPAPATRPPLAVATAPTTAPPVDTITVRDPVNPSDAEIASEFAVEIVAANTVAGANSRLRDGGRPLPAATIAPVLLGSDRSRWYRVIVGAWRTRASADSLLGELRRTKRLGPTSGLVVRAPLAVWLGEVDGRDAAQVSLTEWERRGFPAYALEQEDGRVRIYSGAFETSAAAALLADAIRAAGGTPTVAYRTGRTF